MIRILFKLILLSNIIMLSLCQAQGEENNKNIATLPLKFDQLGKINQLPIPYPSHWMLVHDAAFFHFLEGRFILIDPLEKSLKNRYKGAIPASNIAQFAQSAKRQEFYVIEIFYSRGLRGTRTDVISIYDQKTLAFKEEIILPKPKRMHSMPEIYSAQIINDRFLLNFNFTPATSVYVTDLDKKEVVAEISTPGCSLIYPNIHNGFSSLCSNGGLLTVTLDENGQLLSKQRLPTFFSADQDPLFEKPVIYQDIAYFPSYLGMIQEIDLSSQVPKISEKWSLLDEAERESGWRPGGWQLVTLDPDGQMYIIMNPKGANGTHKR